MGLVDSVVEFAVNGTAIPDVDFDVGESYAGLLPISQKLNETSQLYFWYFPSQNPLAQDEITIWFNGGPGCSSLFGFLQENGPFLWQTGTFKPVKNPYSWVNLTNIVWIEQPVGTGFSQQGNSTPKNVEESTAQFLGFFRNFVDTFDLHHKKVYIAGESFAGKYIPYIADAMLKKNDTEYYNVESILLYDPSLSSDAIQKQGKCLMTTMDQARNVYRLIVPLVAYTDYFAPLFPFNSTFKEDIHKRADSCGYTSFLNENLVFPPKDLLPSAPNDTAPGCDLWLDSLVAISRINPCFDVYHIISTCPLLWSVLARPTYFDYLPPGATLYFNRTDVQKAIHAPTQPWQVCVLDVLPNDDSPDSSLSVLPGVIEKLNRTIIAHGQLDYVLIANGSLLAIQNMTWNGAQGFQQEPKDEFYVPEYNNSDLATVAGSGIFGTTHTERGLTWVHVNLAGHALPQFAPGAGYRHLEFLLGRIGSLTE